jgi:hypothetical protein
LRKNVTAIAIIGLISTILAAFLSAFSLLKDWRELSNFKRTLGMVFTFLFASISIVIIVFNDQQYIENQFKLAYEGKLEPENRKSYKRMIEIVGYPNKSEKSNHGVIHEGSALELNNGAFKLCLNNGKITASANLFNCNSKLMAELNENEWKIEPNSTWDRNYSRSALEIIDDKGEVAFQIQILSDTVHYQVKYYQASGKVLAIYENGNGMAMYLGNADYNCVHIKPIFKYPGSLHLGELAN